jgi:hypothetical protein
MGDKTKGTKEQLKILYGCRCLLTNVKSNRLDYHHIDKKEYGGKVTVDNGVNLIKEIHEWLHRLENTDIELFYLINECLKLYKQCLDRDEKALIEQYETECIPLFYEKYEEYKRRKKKR